MVKYALLSAMVSGLALSGAGMCSMSGDPFDGDHRGTIRSASPAPDINQIGYAFQLDDGELEELRAFLKDHNSIRMKVVAKVGTGFYVYPVPDKAEFLYKSPRDDEDDNKPVLRSFADIPGC